MFDTPQNHIHACVSYDSGALEVEIFFSDLDVGACIL